LVMEEGEIVQGRRHETLIQDLQGEYATLLQDSA